MNHTARPQHPARPAAGSARASLLAFAGWTLYGILTTEYLLLINAPPGGAPQEWKPVLIRWTLQGWAWLLLTWPILAVSRRWAFQRGQAVRAVAAHAAMLVAAQLVLGLTDRVVAYVLFHVKDRPLFYLFSTLRVNAIVYAAFVAGEHAVRNGRASAERKLEAAALRVELAEAQLEALRSQLQPHFLFNALHDISELVYQDPARAERALARVGDLLRASLATAGRQEVTLREELEVLDAYLEIQRLRFT